MALNADNLATAIANALATATAAIYPQSAAGLAAYHGILAQGIADALVPYLTTNTEVVVTMPPDGTGTIR